MIFTTLTKWKQSPKNVPDTVNEFGKTMKELEKQGIKMQIYWTLGRYDAVSIVEAPNEKGVMKVLLPLQDVIDSETMVAVARASKVRSNKTIRIETKQIFPLFSFHFLLYL